MFKTFKIYIYLIIDSKIQISGTIVIDILHTSNVVNISYCIL